MNALKMLEALSTAPLDARIVLQLPNGKEVEVTGARHYCQLVVLTAEIVEPESFDNSAHIEEIT